MNHRRTVYTLSALLLAACLAGPAASAQGQKPQDAEAKEKKSMTEPKEVTTSTGLRYVDQKVGEGQEAKAGDVVEVHYTGWLTNGTKFDSSVDRNQPFTFKLGEGQVIKGWDQGVAGMRLGGKRKLTVPPNLAYGSAAYGPIPGNSTLMFDVELLGVKK